tara:strand:- start:447 stop:920 length:474 start_codon:yes stop_codon:yes gene_type:complete
MKPGSLEYAEWLIDQLLYNSVQSIDARLGEGYHTKNPRLVCELTRLTYEEYKRQENFELEEEKAQEVSSYNFVKSSKSKKPQFKFDSFGIPVGAELQCTLSPHIKCTVANRSNDVFYNGERTSMSAIINSLKGGSNRGPSFWTYRGKLLSDMVDQKS